MSHGGRINAGRNYGLFALMADIRNHNELPVAVPSRGMPDDASYYATDGDRMFICEDSGDNHVKMKRAEEWVKDGSSIFINSRNGKPVWVTNPDWHSHSWLTTNEFEGIINNYLVFELGWHTSRVNEHQELLHRNNISKESWDWPAPDMNIEPAYQAILASMKRFEELGYDARIVFWFDN